VSAAGDVPARSTAGPAPPRLRPPDWPAIMADHDDAADAFITTADRLTDAAWHVRPAEGKWSAAEIVEHVALAYDAMSAEIRGGGAMHLRVPLWKRLVLRMTVLPRLLGGRFPRGAPAPRETRPAAAPATAAEGVRRIRDATAAFRALVTDDAHRRRARPTHPYFGRVRLAPAVRFMAVHTRHHQAQLAAREPVPPPAGLPMQPDAPNPRPEA
jgi:uncharacterized damage-inducible protein DinB